MTIVEFFTIRRMAVLGAAVLGLGLVTPTWAQNTKPNIVVIMGDDIGMWNIGAYHRGLMAGRTPNIDQLATQAAHAQ